MSSVNKHSPELKKICTKCNKTKRLEEFGLMRRGKYGRNSQCKVCRASSEKTRRSDKKIISQTIHRSSEAEYNRCLDIIQGLSTEYNNLIQQNSRDNTLQDQLAHQHEDIIRNLDKLKDLAIKRHIESQAMPDNSFWLSNKIPTDEDSIISTASALASTLTGEPVNRDNVELVFYKPLSIKTLSGTFNDPICLVVITGSHLSVDHIQQIRDMCERCG